MRFSLVLFRLLFRHLHEAVEELLAYRLALEFDEDVMRRILVRVRHADGQLFKAALPDSKRSLAVRQLILNATVASNFFYELDLRDFDTNRLRDTSDQPGAGDGGLADALQLVQLGRDDLRL